MRILLVIARVAASLLLAAFFAFVGYYKAFASLEELARHSAFTTYLPIILGKAFGWFEMTAAVVLLVGSLWNPARRAHAIAALLLAVEQVFSSWIHWVHGEMGMIGQNTVLIVVLLALAWAGGAMRRSDA